MAIRSPICTVVGHVDHGKSSILDAIRGSCVTKGEAGAITQAIGASTVPISIVENKCKSLVQAMKLKFTIPGILFIDTPGHAAFTNLRKRGGSLADIAIVVIDINEGFKPQTIESIQILVENKTPFIIAANKIDLLDSWQPNRGKGLIESISLQTEECRNAFETKIYKIVGELFDNFKIDSDLFYRIDDFTKKIAIVPCSAKTQEGLPELLVVISGLAQKYLENYLKINEEGYAYGTVLEVKEVKGIGVCMDSILYDGLLKVNDTIVIAGLEKPIVTKVRGLFVPQPLSEMREAKCKFNSVKNVSAASGVRIISAGGEDVVSGMPFRSCDEKDVENVKRELQSEINKVVFDTDENGVILKAESLGSLEALIFIFRDKSIPIRRASIGNITKKDIADAEASEELYKVIIGFNVGLAQGVTTSGVEVITGNIIYSLLDKYLEWEQNMLFKIEARKIENLIRPAKILIMPGFVFRQLNPAICGVEVLGGVLKKDVQLMKDNGQVITTLKGLQKEKENIQEAVKGEQVAISMEKVTIGRQVKEGDILYTFMPEDNFRKLKENKKFLSKDEIEVLKEIAEIMRRDNPVWGV